MIIDTHAHCYWENLLPRIEDLVQNMKDKEVTQAIQIGCDIDTSHQAIALAKRFPGVFYATVGHHPETAQDISLSSSGVFLEMKNLIDSHREYIVAIGETGLDYHYLSDIAETAHIQVASQKEWFIAQWDLAQKYDLPLVIHTRDAREDTLKMIMENNIRRAVIHCYSEDPEFAQTLLDFSDGIYFAFGGILTYKKSDTIQKTAQMLPLDRILLETDSPFLSPQVLRGTVNEPANTRYIFEKLCELRSESSDEIEKVIYQNSRRFYSLGN